VLDAASLPRPIIEAIPPSNVMGHIHQHARELVFAIRQERQIISRVGLTRELCDDEIGGLQRRTATWSALAQPTLKNSRMHHAVVGSPNIQTRAFYGKVESGLQTNRGL
jgi:hypothetical protein